MQTVTIIAVTVVTTFPRQTSISVLLDDATHRQWNCYMLLSLDLSTGLINIDHCPSMLKQCYHVSCCSGGYIFMNRPDISDNILLYVLIRSARTDKY